ncbi:MAG TPA: addiction module antitoxin RelB [Planctomycetes bacterium]|jgi:putative addiction module component (TIGR02574 family)|nr:addiction module antitoxin RelB [Planctomycetota bacterium]
MTPKIQDFANEALRLPREARAFLAEKLLESLDLDESVPLSPEWQEEICRRCRELDEGKVTLIPAEEVLREAGERLG